MNDRQDEGKPLQLGSPELAEDAEVSELDLVSLLDTQERLDGFLEVAREEAESPAELASAEATAARARRRYGLK